VKGKTKVPRSVAREEPSARPALPQRDPKDSNNTDLFNPFAGLRRRRLEIAQPVAFSTAAVSAGKYFTPISHTNPEAKIIPDTNRNATCILA
jgi:hypothetical protein